MSTSILFVGNSYTFGRVDPVMSYNAANVHDLTAPSNGGTFTNTTGSNPYEPHPWGGVPGIFKMFTVEAGLDYDVSLSARNASSLRGHFLNTSPAGWDLRGNIGSQSWDKVVLQELSDGALPLNKTGNASPGYFTEYASKIADWIHSGNTASTFTDAQWFGSASAAVAATGASTTSVNTMRSIPANSHTSPGAQIYLYETWARPDLVTGAVTSTTNPDGSITRTTTPGPGVYSSLQGMTDDLHNAYFNLGSNTSRFAGVAPVGDAFQRAVNAGFATQNPYASDALTDGKIDLWWDDSLHASKYGSYLSALTLYGKITGNDPSLLGASERAASDLGISQSDAVLLQRVAALSLDNISPTLSISTDAAALKAGQTAVITFTFSEDPGNTFAWDGISGNVTVSGGALGAISGSGLTRTAIFTPTNGVDNGSASITVAAGSYTDAAGNLGGAGASPTLTFDTHAPAAPALPVLASASDSGSSATDGITKVTTPVVTGTAEAGATVTLYGTDGTTVLGTAVAAGGHYTITTTALGEGSHNLTVKATDVAGNVGAASTATTIVVDTTNPTVTIAAPGSTNSLTQTISGTVTDANAVGTNVTLSEGGTTLGAAVVQADLTWSKAISFSGYGAHTITATDVDLAGNSGQTQVSFTLTAPSAPSDPTAASSVNLSPSQSQTLSGLTSGSLSVNGGGTLTLTGTNTYTGATTVNAGTLLVDGSIVSPTDVKSGGTLGGHGVTGTVTIGTGGTLSPGNSPGVLTTRDLTLAAGATLKEEIGGTAQGQFDQTKVIGAVSLAGANLNLTSYNGFVSVYGDRFTIIDNDGTDAVQGRFAGLSEGASLKLGSHNYLISYRGGDGNDVVLTDVTLPSATTLAPFGTVETSPASQTGTVYALYQGLLGRAPDALGLEGFSASLQAGAKLTDVASAILGSAEHGPAVSDPSAYVQGLYANALHRTADNAGLSYFTGELNAGVSQATVAVQIASSAEAQQANAPAFSTGVFVTDAIDAGVARLYYGLLGRTPDAAGLSGFEAQVKQLAATGGVNGAIQGLANVANAMLDSSEYASTHAGQTSAAFVDSLFVGALGRHADAGGAAFFADELAHGASQAQVALQIAQSPEAQAHLLSQIEMGWHLI